MGEFADEEDPSKPLNDKKSITHDSAGLKAEIEQAGWKVQVVNWVYEQVTGQNLAESLITPITGDFKKIEQNAEAWKKVGESLQAVRANLNHGISELRETWEGPSAAACEALLVGSWTLALEGDAKLADLVASGFTKASEASKKMCDKALELIKKLVDRLIETAITAWIPVAGWANVVRNVIKCIDIVMAVIAIYEALTQLYESIKGLVESVSAMGTSLMKIKDVHSLGDAVNLGLEFDGEVKDVKEKGTAVKDSATGVKDSAKSLKTTVKTPANPATESGGATTASHQSGSSSSPSHGGSSYHTAMSGTL